MDKINKTREAQVKKYGGEEGYRKEMRRRRSLVKRYFLRDNPDKAAQYGGIRKTKDTNGSQTEESR